VQGLCKTKKHKERIIRDCNNNKQGNEEIKHLRRPLPSQTPMAKQQKGSHEHEQ